MYVKVYNMYIYSCTLMYIQLMNIKCAYTSFNVIAVESKRFTPIMTPLTNSTGTTAFLSSHTNRDK